MFCPNDDCPDLLRTGRPGEYRDGVTLCPVCGSALVADEPAATHSGLETGTPMPAHPDAFSEPQLVATYSYRQDAELAASYLEANGVPSALASDDAQNVYAGIGRASGYRLLVAAEYAEQARELLRAVEQGALTIDEEQEEGFGPR